jgi:hypothetical protein
MEFPASSVIQAADYDPEGRTLDVTFTNGRRNTYFSVPDWEFYSLVTAASAVEYFQHSHSRSACLRRASLGRTRKQNPGLRSPGRQFTEQPIAFRRMLI